MDENRLKEMILKRKASFESFYSLLAEYNKKCNLTAIEDENDVYFKHFLDSLAGETAFPQGASVCEVGSGGGFPSIPLKIVREDLKFTLVESVGKKCIFLREAVEKLNLSEVEIKNIRAEDGARTAQMREKFDICCARAVARLNTLAEYCLPFVKVGGAFVAYKGDADGEIEEAENAFKILGGKLEKVEKFELENCGKRCIVTVRKIKPTPEKYPRGLGKERKQPL